MNDSGKGEEGKGKAKAGAGLREGRKLVSHFYAMQNYGAWASADFFFFCNNERKLITKRVIHVYTIKIMNNEMPITVRYFLLTYNFQINMLTVIP